MTTDKFEFCVFHDPFVGMRVNLEVSDAKIVAVEVRERGEVPKRHALAGDTVQVMNTAITIGMPVEDVESKDIEVIHILAAIKVVPQNRNFDLLAI